jgi:hypothetical protein
MSSFVGFLPMNYEARSHPIRYVRETVRHRKDTHFEAICQGF